MPHTQIGFNFPTERLYHINGQPRELYSPVVTVDVSRQERGGDVILDAALKFLKKK